MTEDATDLVVAAYRDQGEWQVESLTAEAAEDIDDLVAAVRPWPGEVGNLGLVAVDEDFFVIVRVQGQNVRVLLSDVTAIDDWPLASGIADLLDLPDPEDEDDPQPAGDLAILADLGIAALDLAMLCDDDDLYPDEVLSEIADRLGFGQLFEDVADTVPA